MGQPAAYLRLLGSSLNWFFLFHDYTIKGAPWAPEPGPVLRMLCNGAGEASVGRTLEGEPRRRRGGFKDQLDLLAFFLWKHLQVHPQPTHQFCSKTSCGTGPPGPQPTL